MFFIFIADLVSPVEVPLGGKVLRTTLCHDILRKQIKEKACPLKESGWGRERGGGILVCSLLFNGFVGFSINILFLFLCCSEKEY